MIEGAVTIGIGDPVPAGSVVLGLVHAPHIGTESHFTRNGRVVAQQVGKSRISG